MLPWESSNSRNYVIKNGILSNCDNIHKQRKYGKCYYIKIYNMNNYNMFTD